MTSFIRHLWRCSHPYFQRIQNIRVFVRKQHLGLFFICGLCLTILVACFVVPQVHSFEEADRILREQLVPQIQPDINIIRDEVASQYVIPQNPELAANLADFPLYAALPTNDPQTVYLEVISSAEKGNAAKQGERWLVDVAQAFNRQNIKVSSGQTIRVGIRNAPSGLGLRLITHKALQPNAYTPSSRLWLELLKDEGINWQLVQPSLFPGTGGFVVREDVYQQLATNGAVTFERLLDAILSGKLKVGYPNPYTSSTSLNLLYTILWQAANHNRDRQPLTVQDLQDPQVSSVFDTFQQQVLVTTVTTLELKDIFIRDPQKLQAFPLDSQAYSALKQIPGFEQTRYIPFGVSQSSPLVGFDWNTPLQQEALKQFADFAMSSEMQKLTRVPTDVLQYLNRKDLPPTPTANVIKAAQSFWKRRKDGGRTVYMMLVIDTSGSMEGGRLTAVREGVQKAIKEINAGNQVGLVTFNDKVHVLVHLAPFDTLQHKRLLAALDTLQADGQTALYDGVAVGLAELTEQRKTDPNGLFRLLLLSDGDRTIGLTYGQMQEIMRWSEVRIYPIAYGEVNQQELTAIAALREATVQSSNPKNVQRLLKEMFQTNL